MSKDAVPAAPGPDLFTFIPVGSQECEITNPLDGSGTGFFIAVQSINAPEVKKVTKAVENARLKLSNKGKNFTADEVRANVIAILTAAVTGWRWGLDSEGRKATAGGDQLEYTPVNVRKVLEVDTIANQLDTFMSDDSRFFKHLAQT